MVLAFAEVFQDGSSLFVADSWLPAQGNESILFNENIWPWK